MSNYPASALRALGLLLADGAPTVHCIALGRIRLTPKMGVIWVRDVLEEKSHDSKVLANFKNKIQINSFVCSRERTELSWKKLYMSWCRNKIAIAILHSKAADEGCLDECLVLGTGVNGLLIGQKEPKEVESTNPFPNPDRTGQEGSLSDLG